MPKVSWTFIAYDIKKNWPLFLVIIAISALTFGHVFQDKRSTDSGILGVIAQWPIFVFLVILGFVLRFACRGWISRSD